MKKTNPRRIPATMADVNRAKQSAMSEAVKLTSVLFMTVLRDKEHFGHMRLLRVLNAVERLSDSINEGYLTVPDLVRTLRDEVGIKIYD